MSAVSGSRARWAVLAAVLAVTLASTAHAEESSPSGSSAAAWHPSGVGTVTAPTYPADTLHVGTALGQETDRTYLRFDPVSLPDDAEVDVVTVTIAVDPDAGTSSPETAVILGCAMPDGFDPDGSAPSAVECDGAPEATFVAGTAPAFTLSLPAPLDGAALDVALVPGGGDTWHVGFTEATAVVVYDLPARTTATTTRPRPTVQPAFNAPTGSEPIALPPMTIAPPAATGGAIADEAAASAPAAVTGVPVSGSSGFRYAAIFGLPLALLVLVALLGDGLTRPVRLREDAA